MERLINTLKRQKINSYQIEETHTESIELFYVLNKLETNRATNTDDIDVTIFVDVDDKRGSSTFSYSKDMSDEDLQKEIDKKIYAAKFALNPYYEIPYKSNEKLSKNPTNLDEMDLSEAAKIVVRAMLNAKQYQEGSFSANEIFLTRETRRVINFNDVDLSATSTKLFIELIPSWEKGDEEVETYNNIELSSLDEKEITRLIDECMELTKARFEAKPLKLDHPVNVIIEGEDVPQFFRYFVDNLSYSYKYQKMNRFEVGQPVQDENCPGDKLNIDLSATYAFDWDGVIINRTNIVKDGVASNMHGNFRFGYYLGIEEPTGMMNVINVEPGKTSFEDMRKEPYVRCVKFSSFQRENNSGFFGGEVRLGFYFDGEKEVPVTGFSIAGNLHNSRNTVILSSETQSSLKYSGPKYLLFKDVAIN